MRASTRIAGLLSAMLLAGCIHLPDTAHPAGAADPAAATLTPATPLSDVIARRQVQPLDPAAASPLLDQAMVELAKTDPAGRYRGVTYDLTKDNALAPRWIVQTPDVWNRRAASVGFLPLACNGNCSRDFDVPLCRRNADCSQAGAVCGHLRVFDVLPDLAGKRLCLGPADAVIDRFYQPIAAAGHAVDITALQPIPDFRFLAALRNGITTLARSGRPVTVRVLVGQYPPEGADARALLADLVRDAAVPGARLTVYAAAMRSCTGEVSCGSFSWNHAKMVAADGRTALVGGENMWSQDYLIGEPVQDISMQVQGSAVADAHRFADTLWHFVCHHQVAADAVSSFVYRSGAPAIILGCLDQIPLGVQPTGAPSGVPILASARLGAGITDDFANQDDLARDLMFGAARRDILAVQQDVAFVLPGTTEPLYPELTLKAWATFMLAGRGDVFLVLSNLGAKGQSGEEYSNGVPPEAVARKMLSVAQASSPLPQDAVIELLCRHFHLAPFRFGPDAAWPSGHPIGNHGKFWMVDDRYFYLGSDNLYPVDLQEFGFIVDDRAAAAELRRKYWDPLWRWSHLAAISGSDAPACVLRTNPVTANADWPATRH